MDGSAYFSLKLAQAKKQEESSRMMMLVHLNQFQLLLEETGESLS